MLKRTIQYEDFNGNNVVEEHYFNLSKSELVELEADYQGGLGEALTAIVASNDLKSLIREMKRIVLMSYGQKSLDGKRFVKSEELRTEFSQTNAYDALFMELATNENAAAEFIRGIVPRDLGDAIQKAQNEATITQSIAAVRNDTLAPPPPTQTIVDL